MNRQIVCVLGMHRSGTSAVAGILHHLGVYLGPEDRLLEPTEDNPRGYWELQDIMELNDAILERLGGNWHEPPFFPPGWAAAPELADLRQQAHAILQTYFATADLWGWKDPRTCLLLPFWQSVLADWGEIRYVICVRNPVDVARSLARRDGFSPEKSGQLWLTYMADALRYTAGRTRYTLFYEDLITHGLEAVRRLAAFLGRDAALQEDSVRKKIETFLDPGLHHHRTALADVANARDIPFPARALFLALRARAAQEEDAIQEAILYDIIEVLEPRLPSRDKMTGASLLFRMISELQAAENERRELIRHIHRLQAQIENAQAIITSLLESRSWRITAPLRHIAEFLRRIRRRAPEVSEPGTNGGPYARWVRLYDTLTETDRTQIRAHIDRLPQRPKFSVLMPLQDTSESCLRQAIESVCQQIYPDWELWVIGSNPGNSPVHSVLQAYQTEYAQIHTWLTPPSENLADTLNRVLDRVTGTWITLLDPKDVLPPHALYMAAVEINRHPDAELLYSDEDRIDDRGVRSDPDFKPDLDPDLMHGQNMIGRLVVYRTDRMRSVGGFRRTCEGALEWDLNLRILEQTTPDRVRHIPHVLYHRRTRPDLSPDSTETLNMRTAQYRALCDHFDRTGLSVKIIPVRGFFWRVRYPLPYPAPLTSIVIPTRNRRDLLQPCLESILQRSTYANYEIIVVDNGSDDPDTQAYLREIARNPRIRVLPYPHPFNYAAINNFAVMHARGDVICFLNNDMEVITPDWLEELVSHALRPEVGAVGAMLYYPDNTIQHAGVILGLGGVAGHIYHHHPRGWPGMRCRNWLTRNFSAVTGACLVMRRDVFLEVGGFDERWAVALNDVDLCLRIRARGYRIIWTPFAELYHHGGASRGAESIDNPRLQKEIAMLKERWGHILYTDPAHNPNLSLQQPWDALAFPPRVGKPWRDPAPDGSS